MPFGMKPPRQRWRLSLDIGDSIWLSVLSREKYPDKVCHLTYFDPEQVEQVLRGKTGGSELGRLAASRFGPQSLESVK